MLRLLVISDALHLAVDVGGRRFWTGPLFPAARLHTGNLLFDQQPLRVHQAHDQGVDRNLYPPTTGVPRRNLTDVERLADVNAADRPSFVQAPFFQGEEHF
jgi:hypothetical protein